MFGDCIKRVVRFLCNPTTTNIGIRIFITPQSVLSLSSPYTERFSLLPASFRTSPNQPEQIADPFIYLTNEGLYCFYEEKTSKSHGRIRVLIMFDDSSIEIRDCDLGLENHVSFPFIYQENKQEDRIFMIPETASIREVALYRPVNFPVKWEKVQVLLRGNYVDSHLLKKDNHYYLFTTEKIDRSTSQGYSYQLNIYISDNLKGEYRPHPLNPITTGRKYSRSGGSILEENSQFYRISQDCFDSYGKEINIFKIIKLTPTEYEENLQTYNWIINKFGHNLGGHHIHTATRDNFKYFAVDFNFKDSYIQRFIKLLSR
jgi:hypothetical protein